MEPARGARRARAGEETAVAHQVSRLKVRDVALNLYRDGSGERLIFFHGAGGMPGWTPFFASLAEHFEVWAPEHPGFGQSDDPKWIRNVGDAAMLYLDFLEEHELTGVHLVGNSLGGWIAAELAVRDRSRLKSLTLLAPAGVRVKGVPVGDNFIWSPEEQARSLFHDQAFAETMLQQKPSEEQMQILLKNRFAATKYGWEPRWFNPDLEKWLHRLKLPAHVVWGDNDKLLPPAYAEIWARELPRAKVTRVPQCGHLPHIEKAGPTARAVIDFLKGLPA
jgi:pimeloyl-ACP methyl ester carboxylesterase